MKGNEAEYVIPFGNVIRQHTLKKGRRAINEIKRFVWKHARKKQVFVSNEVNELLLKNSKNIPARINALLVVDGEGIRVFLKGGKGLEVYKKKKVEEEKKKKEAKKEAGKAQKAGEKAGEKKEMPKAEEEKTEAEKEKERLAKEKKEMEKAAQKTEIKRG